MANPLSYQAVVFAGGRGNRMSNLIDYVPKSLLPMSNIPMFWYPLRMLSRSGFRECILVVNKAICSEIESLLSSPGHLPSLNGLDVRVWPFYCDPDSMEEAGTCDALCEIKDQLEKDFLVVSGDLVTDLSLHDMLNYHESTGSIITCLLTDSALSGSVPGPKERQKKYRDFVALAQETNQLLFLTDEEDFSDDFAFENRMFYSCGRVDLHAKYKDVHLYIMKHSVLNLLKERSFTSIKADLIPYILEGQYAKSSNVATILNLAQVDPSDNEKDADRSLPSIFPTCIVKSHYKCFAYLHQKGASELIAQCNNIGSYFEANKTVHRYSDKICPGISPGKRSDKTSGITIVDSLVDENTSIGGKCQIKRSTVSPSCIIEANSKIDNSILMTGVRVCKGASIKNCIVFPRVSIGERADLNMCIVATDQNIPNSEKLANTIVCPEKEMILDD